MGFSAAPLTDAAPTQGLTFETVLGGVTKAMGTIMQSQAQSQAAEAQAAYQQQLAEQRAQENYERQVAMRQEQAQADESINRKRFQAELQARGVKATALTSAASAGVSGLSVDALMQEYNIQSSMYLEGLERQKQLDQAITQQNVENIGKNAYIPAPVEQPNPMLGILGGAQSFFGFLQQSSQAQKDIKTSNLNRL